MRIIQKCDWHERTPAVGMIVYRNLPRPAGLCRPCFNRALENPILRHWDHWVLEL